jgi:hypothetical protein
MIIKLALSTLTLLVSIYYFKLSMTHSIIAALVCYFILYVIDTSRVEGYGDDTSRYVRFGDHLGLWTHTNRYVRMNKNKYVDTSAYMAQPDELPRNSIWELFYIEDATDSRWMVGSEIPVKYGDKICLRSWLTNPNIWVSPYTDQTVIGTPDRKVREILTLESPDAAGSDGQPIKYGDSVYLKTWRNMYLSLPDGGVDSGDGGMITQVEKKDTTCIFRLYDDYGQAQIIDWATRGTATQSGQYEGSKASNAINGNNQSYSHTENKQNAWWQVELPRDVDISNIKIINRKDCCQERLQNFDVMVLDKTGAPVHTIYFKDTQAEYVINNINKTGRTVKIQLRDKNFLHMAKVSVYGDPINYSTLMETPVVADLVTKPVDLTDNTSVTFYNDSIPYIGKNNSISLSLFIKPEAGNTGIRNIISKGPLSVMLEGNAISILTATTISKVSIKTNNKLDLNEWNHFAVAIRPTISPETGWVYGEFTSKPVGITDLCCYVLHPQRKEYYRLTVQGSFASATKHSWSADVVKNMSYLGDLVNNIPIMTTYINGNMDSVNKLNSNAIISNEPIIIGQNKLSKSMIGKIHNVRMYNYDINAEAALRDSRSQFNAQTLNLIRETMNSSIPRIFDANSLPTIGQEVSVTFWALRKGSGSTWQPIFWNGPNEKENIFGMWWTPKGNLYSTVKAYGTGSNGVKDIKYNIKPNVWYHVSMILRDKTQSIYINGKPIISIELPGQVQYDVSSLTVGGFEGKINNFKYHNYALSNDEILSHIGVHPDYKVHESIQQIWNQQGCSTNLFANIEENSDLVDLMKAGKDVTVEANLKTIVTAANKGDKDKLIQCYGPYASKLFAKLQKSGKLLKYSMNNNQGKQCLPTAPFSCITKDVNDYDIRTHKDFHKYTLVDNIIPPDGSTQGSNTQGSKTLANDIYNGAAGMDAKTIDNIIVTKQNMSSNAAYQEAIDKVKKYCKAKQHGGTHPEYHKLVAKLNKLTVSQVDGKDKGFHDFKVQAHKCSAIFDKGGAELSHPTLLKIFNDRIKSDPQFQALMTNIIESRSSSDSEFSQIMKKAQDEKYLNEPKFQAFLLKVTKEQLATNPIYRKIVADMIGVNTGRIVNNPEYNKYAEIIQEESKQP